MSRRVSLLPMKPVAPVTRIDFLTMGVDMALLQRAEHALVAKQLSEQGVANRHREAEPPVAQVMMRDASAAGQKPRRQRDTPRATTPAAPNQTWAVDEITHAVEAQRAVADVHLQAHAQAEVEALDERAVDVERFDR